MDYQTLGTSSLKISRLGFGCMSLDDNGEKMLQAGLDNGVNFFDTADIYQNGLNEEMIGRAFQGKRQEVILATKAGNEKRVGGSPGWHWNPRKKHLVTALEASLRRLQTDYIDLFQLHGGMLEDPIDEIIGTFEMLKEQGKIRFYGISSIRPEVIREYVRRSGISSVMLQYSLLDRRPEEEILDFLLENKVGVLARGPLAKGMLVSKAPAQFLNYNDEEVASMARQVNNLSGDHRTPTGTALQFVLDHPAVTSAVVGIRTKEHLTEALRALKAPPLDAAEKAALNRLMEPNCYTEFR